MVRGIVQGLDQRNGKVEVAQVDMEQELRDLGLTQFFPTSQWPPHAPGAGRLIICFCVIPLSVCTLVSGS